MQWGKDDNSNETTMMQPQQEQSNDSLSAFFSTRDKDAIPEVENNPTGDNIEQSLHTLREIAVTPSGGVRCSPITEAGAASLNSLGTVSTKSVLEADATIENLMENDINDADDGGDSDEKGEGYTIIADLHEGVAKVMREHMLTDYRLT